MPQKRVVLVFVLLFSVALFLSGQTAAVKPSPPRMAEIARVDNYIMRLPDAYIVYEPTTHSLQIAAMGMVLSYGEGWERRQVKPYLYHLRHSSWRNYFWKINTSRREVYLVWGGLFGGIGGKPGAGAPHEVDGAQEDLALEVTGGAQDQAPQRFLIRFSDAQLFFTPATGDLRLAAAGTTISPCDNWQALSLKDFLFHIRLKTWKGFYWKVNTSKLAAWRTSGAGAVFGKLGGEDTPLPLTMTRTSIPISLPRLRTVLTAAERAKLKEIAHLVASGRPIAEINKLSSDFVRQFPGVEPASAVGDLAEQIKTAENRMEEIRNKRQEAQTAFEGFDQKANQLFNMLSTIMKNMKETQQGIIRNMI
jgi:hypothetical protein